MHSGRRHTTETRRPGRTGWWLSSLSVIRALVLGVGLTGGLTKAASPLGRLGAMRVQAQPLPMKMTRRAKLGSRCRGVRYRWRGLSIALLVFHPCDGSVSDGTPTRLISRNMQIPQTGSRVLTPPP